MQFQTAMEETELSDDRFISIMKIKQNSAEVNLNWRV